jgi:peptidyl-tRNA hydrolase, PTH1 family
MTMKLLVGLGNPGRQYAKHRHNIGFMALDVIANHHQFSPWKSRFQGQAADGLLGDEKCLLLKPETYMNESGKAVGEAVRFHRIALTDIIVFHDELDLAPGKIRVKTGGGNAGHNGLRSISHLVGNDTVRVRMGIGHPGVKELVQAWVLGDFLKADAAWLMPLLDATATAAPFLAAGDAPRFMTEVARLQEPPTAAKPADPTAKPSAVAKLEPATKTAEPSKPSTAMGETLSRWLKRES